MKNHILLLPILVPFAAGIAILLLSKAMKRGQGAFTLFVTAANLAFSFFLFRVNLNYDVPWFGSGIDFSLRVYSFSGFMILAAALFAFLTALYSCVFMKGKSALSQFYAYLLITLSFVNGAFMADGLIVMLFFWEGLLLTLFGMIAIGRINAFRTATKAFIIMGASDLCMMAGIGLTIYLAGTQSISKISLALTPLSSLAFALLAIGAISKAGAMPFHTWIPDAAEDAPLPFMAFMPASIDKLLGIYFLTRISLDLFRLEANSFLSVMLMALGSVTILAAVMMALVQKDYKKLLSYHAVSQAGYMILGIGTCLPIGIVGGIFHMVNNALYKSCLFFTAGCAEKQAGATNLEHLGGLGKKMPVTFACFVVAALSISGVPPFNGFFSKELIYDASAQRGLIFYLAAAGGSFFTAASFLKLGHAAFLGGLSEKNKGVREASWPMLAPMIVISLICVFFGLFNYLPIDNFIKPVLGAQGGHGHHFSGWPENSFFVVITLLVLALALLHHVLMARNTGSGLKAVDDIHYAPLLRQVYSGAEKKYFDPYEIGRKAVILFSRLGWGVDRAVNWVYDGFVPGAANALSLGIRRLHSGYYVTYIVWSLLGMLAVLLLVIR